MNNNEIRILLVDGGDRQTLPLAEVLKKQGYYVATLNASKLDNGYSSRYPDEKIIRKGIRNSKEEHIKAITELAQTRKYTIMIATSDDTAEKMSLKKEELQKYTKISVVDPELFYMAYDKYQTMKVCMENDIPCPKTYANVKRFDEIPYDNISYPVVVKPRKSFGAIGYRKFDDKKQLQVYCKSLGEDLDKFVIQEYISQKDIQYECAMFMDEKSEVKTALVFSKNRWFPVDGGSSTCNVTVERPDIVENCTKLLKTIGWKGAADIDLIQDPKDNTAKIIEINPRVSGSVKIVLKAGVNIAEQIVSFLTGREIKTYTDYKTGIRLRCIHTDLLWFIKSPDRFKTTPSWFSFKNTYDQIWSIKDPWPFFTFSIQSLLKYKKEMKKRER